LCEELPPKHEAIGKQLERQTFIDSAGEKRWHSGSSNYRPCILPILNFYIDGTEFYAVYATDQKEAETLGKNLLDLFDITQNSLIKAGSNADSDQIVIKDDTDTELEKVAAKIQDALKVAHYPKIDEELEEPLQKDQSCAYFLVSPSLHEYAHNIGFTAKGVRCLRQLRCA
jgi:chaperonin GroEL (HSP60 family)